MLPQSCPLCLAHSDLITVVTNHVAGAHESDNHAFFQCNSCGIIFQYPYYSDKELEKFYIDEFEAFMHKRSGDDSGWNASEAHIVANQSTYHRRESYLSDFLYPGINLLEIGCSSGFMLLPFRDKGYKCTGIEPSEIFRTSLNSKGIPTFSSIESLKSDLTRKFDLICHFFVLEHVSDPLSFLLNQIELCEKGGKIVFEIPSSSDALVQIYDIPEFERFYWSKPHPWYFNYTSLEYLLKKSNHKYSIKPYQRYDLSNHINWALSGSPGGQSRFTDKLGSEIEEAYKFQLIDRGFYDTLIAVIEV